MSLKRLRGNILPIIVSILIFPGLSSCEFFSSLFNAGSRKDPFSTLGVSISRPFWGMWTRTDTEQYWYFGDKLVTISWPSLNGSNRTTYVDSCGETSLRFTDKVLLTDTSTLTTVTKVSEGVLRVERGSEMPFRLLLYRGPNSSFSMDFKKHSSISGSMLSQKALSLVGIGSIEVVIQNILNSEISEKRFITSDTVTITNAIIGDAYQVSVPSQPSIPPVIVIPQEEDVNAGIVVLSGLEYSMKAEIEPVNSNKKHFYAGETPTEANVYFKFRNDGMKSFPNMGWTLNQGTLGNLVPYSGYFMTGTVSSIPPKSFVYAGWYTFTPPASLSAGSSLYEDTRFAFAMHDGSGNQWADSVPLRIYREGFKVNAQASLTTMSYLTSVLASPENEIYFDITPGFPVLGAPYSLIVTARANCPANSVYCVVVDRNLDPRLLLADTNDFSHIALAAADTEMSDYLASLRNSTPANTSEENATTILRGGSALSVISPGETQFWRIDCTRSEPDIVKALTVVGPIKIVALSGSNSNPNPGDAFGVGFTVRNSGDPKANLDDIFVKLVAAPGYESDFEYFTDDGVTWNIWPKAPRERATSAYRCDGSLSSSGIYKAGFSAFANPSSLRGESFIVGQHDYTTLEAKLVTPVSLLNPGTGYMEAAGGLSAKVKTGTLPDTYALQLEFYEGEPLLDKSNLIQVRNGTNLVDYYEFNLVVDTI